MSFHCLPTITRNKYSPKELRDGNKIHTLNSRLFTKYCMGLKNFSSSELSITDIHNIFLVYIIHKQILRTKNHLLSSSGTKSA